MYLYENLSKDDVQDTPDFTDPFLTVIPNQSPSNDLTDFNYDEFNNAADILVPPDAVENWGGYKDSEISYMPDFDSTSSYPAGTSLSSHKSIEPVQRKESPDNSVNSASVDLTAIPESPTQFSSKQAGHRFEQPTYIPNPQEPQPQFVRNDYEYKQPSYFTDPQTHQAGTQFNIDQSQTKYAGRDTYNVPHNRRGYISDQFYVNSPVNFLHERPQEHEVEQREFLATPQRPAMQRIQSQYGIPRTENAINNHLMSNTQNHLFGPQTMYMPQSKPRRAGIPPPMMLKGSNYDADLFLRQERPRSNRESNHEPQSDVVSIPREEYEQLLKYRTKTSLLSVKNEESNEEVIGSSKLTEERRGGAPKTNVRSKNIQGLDPTRYYIPSPQARQSWAPHVSGGFRFNYTDHGELDPESKLPPRALEDFIDHHPWGNNLRLWVQNVPADSAGRYLTKDSSRCRFENCPVSTNIIKKGELRVALDEWDWHEDHAKFDPYHIAGYVHLFCLEKNLDFPALCKTGQVKGDTRILPEGRNKMAITRDHASMAEIVDRFIEESKPWDPEGRKENWFRQSLTYKLTKEHLAKQSAIRQNVRAGRGGNSIDKHLNNLDVMVANQATLRSRKPHPSKGRILGPRGPRKCKAPEKRNE